MTTRIEAHPAWLIYFLLLTAVLCGALIMVIEVLGSRVIGPFFGVSLFIWTSLISVAMISLALGYSLGGRLADRFPDPKYLYQIIMVAGLLVLLIPVLKAPILKLCVPLGLRTGSFIATILLFGPSLFLLGCVSPFIIRIAADNMKHLGRTVGGFYAVSTLGSVAGTAITGFVLIAWLGIDEIFQLTGILLVLLSSLYFILLRHFKLLLALILVPVLWVLQPSKAYPTVVMDNGVKVSLLDSVDSHYGNLKVVEYQYNEIRLRELLIDGLVQGGVDMASGLSVYEYSYFLQFIPYSIKPDMTTALMIGMGAGVIPSWLEDQGVNTDVVDIDPEIFHLAKKWFNVNPNGNYMVEDARYFLIQNQNSYDLVLLDVFSGDTTPTHLLSVESMGLIKAQLTSDGLVAINLAADLSENGFMTASIIKTLEQVFDQVELYPAFNYGGDNLSGNLAVVAYMGPPRAKDLTQLNDMEVHSLALDAVQTNLGKRFYFPEDMKAMVLSDDYNPIDVFDAETREGVRKIIIESTPWEILLYSS